jgi:hypothetical protein
MADEARKVIVKFTKAKDYRNVPATGAWGGISATGEITFDFFVEKSEAPEVIELEVDDVSTTEVSRSPEMIVRESQVGIVIRPDIAYTIGDWLMKTAAAAGVKPVASPAGGNPGPGSGTIN